MITVQQRIDIEQVKVEVGRFWEAMRAKRSVEEFYDHASTVFGSTAIRPEPGRLAATRRAREYFQPKTSLAVITGPIDVVPIGDTAALATYTFQLQATKVEPLSGKLIQEHIRNGRATQLFALDPDGNLRILHEHLSVPSKD